MTTRDYKRYSETLILPQYMWKCINNSEHEYDHSEYDHLKCSTFFWRCLWFYLSRGSEYGIVIYTKFIHSSKCLIMAPYASIMPEYASFLIEIHSMQDWTATTGHGVTRKGSIKRLKHTGNLFRKNLQLTGIC